MNTVDPNCFVARMNHRWTRDFNNVSSEALRSVWKQIAITFNRKIEMHGKPDGDRWKVLQPGTGQGKSQGLAVYCSMLDTEDHPGILIVTRLKTQADELAQTINELAREDVAVSYHSDNRCDPASLAFVPVVVICHRAFELALDAATKRDEAFSAFMAWRQHGRKLVVIDEALDIVEEAHVTYSDIKWLVAALPDDVVAADGPQMAVINTVGRVLKELTQMAVEGRAAGTPAAETMLRMAGEQVEDDHDLTPLRQALRNSRLDLRMVRKNDADENRIRCRNVIDEAGNCQPCDVFLMLPHGKEADTILEGVIDNMPGIKAMPWSFEGTKRRIRKGQFDEALVAYAKGMSAGKVPASTIKRDLGMAPNAWKDLTKKLRDPESSLSQTLTGAGVRYLVKRTGKTQRAYLVR